MKKVLIVEDDKDFLWILRQALDHQDFSVLYALDGEEGFNQADAQSQMTGTVKPDKFIVKANITPTSLLEIIKKELA